MSAQQLTSSVGSGAYSENGDVGRELAIPGIGKAPWGAHFCQFYDSKQDLLDTVVPYFLAGLESDEMCLWVTSDPLEAEEAATVLREEVDDVERRVAQGQIVIMPAAAWYGDQARGVDPERCIKLWQPNLKEALAHGYAGVRASGNVSWLEARHWAPFMSYESALGQRFAHQRVLTLCTYPLGMCDSPKMIDVLMRHQFALIKHGEWTVIEPSEQKRATAAVERMNRALTERAAELRSALAELHGFSRWATEDLRAPLRSITSFGEWLAESCEPKMDDEERRMLAHIRTSAARMGVLIADIQAYSSAQENVLHPRPLDLEALAREVWATLTETVDGRRVDLRIMPMPSTYGDQGMLTQVLASLLGNAVKFAGRQSDVRIEVGALTMNGEDVYYVRDNGVGFDPAHAGKVFDPFERLHDRAEYEGSGMGLTTVKQIISRHGGRVWAEGSPGAGATIYFTLPDPGRSASGAADSS